MKSLRAVEAQKLRNTRLAQEKLEFFFEGRVFGGHLMQELSQAVGSIQGVEEIPARYVMSCFRAALAVRPSLLVTRLVPVSMYRWCPLARLSFLSFFFFSFFFFLSLFFALSSRLTPRQIPGRVEDGWWVRGGRRSTQT